MKCLLIRILSAIVFYFDTHLFILVHKIWKLPSPRTPQSAFLRIQYFANFLSHSHKHLVKNVCVHVCVLSLVWLSVTPHCGLPGSPVHGIFQAGILKWLLFPTPGCIPDPGIKPAPPVSRAFTGRFFTTAPPGKSYQILKHRLYGNNFISDWMANKWVLVPRWHGNFWVWMTLKGKYLLRRQTHWVLRAGYTVCFSVNGTCVFTQLEKQTSVHLLLSVWNTLYQ